MRAGALYIAFFVVAAALLSHRWASVPEQPGDDYVQHMWSIDVGLRNFHTQLGWDQRTKPLRELNGMGVGFEHKGLAALVGGIAALVAMILALALARKPRSLVVRIALCVPLAGSLMTTLVFWGALDELHYLHIGWPIYASLTGVILAALAIVWPRPPA